MRYKEKETGEIKELKEVKKEYDEIIGNSHEFDEYKDDFESYLKDFYEVI